MAHGFEFLVESRHLHESGKVSSCFDGDGHMRNGDAEDVVGVAIKSNPINIGNFLPVL